MYRAALQLRRRRFVGDEALEWADAGEDVIVIRRGGGTTVIVNFGSRPVPLPASEVLLASGDLERGSLPPDTAVWLSE
jgi:alpha-glucosidase